MVKHMVTVWAMALILSVSSHLSASQIPWTTSYNDGLKKAKAEDKTLLVFFTGSDWCGWCQKLDTEALDTAAFANLAQDKFVFVKLDFPAKSKLSPTETQENKELQKRFAVRGFPTIVLLTPNEEQIGVTGYRAGGGAEYANHLLKMVQDYSGLKQKVSALKMRAHSVSELKALHALAKEFQAENDCKEIAYVGFDTEEGSYFKLERLRDLYAQGQNQSEEAIQLKKSLQGQGQANDYHLALLEFDRFYQTYKTEGGTLAKMISPLKTYVEHWGHEDRENTWRLQMVISQVFFEEKEFSQALKYAKGSMAFAPNEMQREIAVYIKELEKQASALHQKF